MLAFQCGVDPSSPDTQSSNKDYNEYLIDLYGLLGEVGPESR